MPQLGLTMTEGTVTRWMVEPGDRVDRGQPVVEIMTDKITYEVEAPAAGVIGPILVSDGEVVPVGTVLGTIGASGETVAEAPAAVPAPAAAGAVGAVTKVEAPATHESAKVRPEVLATPAARRAAKERGIDLSAVAGSGPDGVITEADVLGVTAGAALATVPSHAGPKAPKKMPLNQVKRVTAQRMAESSRTAPQFWETVRVDMSSVMELRARLAAAGTKVTISDMLLHALGRALAEHPEVNATFAGDCIEIQPEVNIGFAVATDDGLVVPVIRDVPSLSLTALSAKAKELADRARAGRLTLEEVSGASFTISNLGMFGVESFAPIINPPQAAIMGVGQAADTPVVIDGGIHIRPMAAVTMTSDHRVIDGAVAAQFLAAFKALVERAGEWMGR
ncbi:MAG: 2-oxo acid dehydrogenase subunit E2 [Firmicutes bacterium]|nr:2-oxo acid dehydrogenase subunit E2 [Bacillota bacterium]